MSRLYTKPQSDFFHLDCKFPAFVGGYGSGKTELLLGRAFRDKFTWPSSRVALYEPTFSLAKLVLIPRMLELLDTAKVKYLYNKSDQIIRISGAGEFIVRSLTNPETIVGFESFRSHIDEIDTLPFSQAMVAWQKIISRDRQKIKSIGKRNASNQTCVYTTPEGFNFVYEMWEKRPKEKGASKEIRENFKYVRAKTESNPHLDESYIEALKSQYPENLVKAYLDGEFTNLTSGVVYRMYNKLLNESNEIASNSETLYIGMDFNVNRGCAVVHILRNGHPHAVDEIVNTLDTPETIRILKERYPQNQVLIFADAAGNQRKSGDASITDIRLLRMAGFSVTHANVNPEIKNRIYSMNAMFCNANGERRYRVNTAKCPFYASKLEQQTYDANGIPEKGSGKGDDILDAAGYYIHNKFPLSRPNAGYVRLTGL